MEQRKALLAAVRILTNNGQHALAQQLWDASSKIGRCQAVVTGESR